MQLPFEDVLKTLIAECYVKRNFVFVMFLIISLLSLAIGANWAKKYTASTIIHVAETNILQSLMKGTAEATRTIDHVTNSREIIYGEKIMNEVLADTGWLADKPSEIRQEQIKEGIKKRTIVAGLGEGLLKIEFSDTEPDRAFKTTKRLAELFIREGEKSKSKESKEAYDFIENQVKEYLLKLTKVENDLRDFRSDNPDARPGMEAGVSAKIVRHQSNIEQAKLDLRETEIRRESLVKQLSGEAAITISQSKEGQYKSKIAILQEALEKLRLDYQDTYPDVIRIKFQIVDLKKSLEQEVSKRKKAQLEAKNTGHVFIDESILLNPIYQQLRTDAAKAETKITTLKARIRQMTQMLNKQFSRSRKIHGGEAELSQLTRDYEVNRGIYQDLLRRRENARVSRSLDLEGSGLTYEIQEPAKLPLIPTGIRFMHFVIAGLVLGLMIPIGLIFVLLQLDPRIRFSQAISSDLELPIISEISNIRSSSELHKEKINLIYISVGLLIIFALYGYMSWFKFMGKM